MPPEFEMLEIFPDLANRQYLTDAEASLLAGFWEDFESESAKLAAIAWWLSQTEGRPDSQP